MNPALSAVLLEEKEENINKLCCNGTRSDDSNDSDDSDDSGDSGDSDDSDN